MLLSEADMNLDAGIGLLRRTRFPHGRVRQVAVPPAARALTTLAAVDYQDAFLVEAARAHDRTAEEWARTLFEHPPMIMRRALRALLTSALGLRLGPLGSDRFVEGWEVRHSTPDVVRLGASSRIGLSAELLLQRERHTLLFVTVLRLETLAARAAWAALSPVHREVARRLLEPASRTTA
jgi:hypothetical protein